MDTEASARIIVAGTGPAGLIAALGLAGLDMPVTLAGPAARADDGRTTALMRPALRLLDEMGVLAPLAAKAAPLKAMRIVDATSRLIRSPVVTFRAAEIGEDFFGLNIPNRDLNATLEAAVIAHAAIDWRRSLVEAWAIEAGGVTARLADGTSIGGALAVAADGRAVGGARGGGDHDLDAILSAVSPRPKFRTQPRSCLHLDRISHRDRPIHPGSPARQPLKPRLGRKA